MEHYASTKCAKKFDAERVLKSKYIPQEVNAYNRTNVLQVKRGLLECLEEFRDEVLIHSSDGIRKKSAGTINRQQTNIRNFIDYAQQKNLTELSEVTEDIIRDYIQNHLIKANEKKPNTVYKDVQILKNFFQWARKKFFCNEDPTVNMRNPKPAPSTPRYFTHEQVKEILTKAKEPYKAMFKLQYLTGMRIQELLNVEWSDINADRKLIIVRVREGNKAKRETLVHLNATALEVIKGLEKEKGENKFLFTNQLGNQYSQAKISSYAIRHYKKLNIPTEDPLHSWRHTCASHLVIAEVSLYKVKEVLRHKTIKETEIYAHLSRESVQDAVEKLTL